MTNRLMTSALTLSLTLSPTFARAAEDSPTLVRQTRQDFAAGKPGFVKDGESLALDPQTFADLNVQSLIDVLVKFAPSRLAQDRLAALLTNPYLDARVITDRQQAARLIAGDEELFALLAATFEVRRYGGVLGKVNAFVRDSVGLSRTSFTRGLPNPGLLNLSSAGRGLLVALSGFWQYGLYEKVGDAIHDPSVQHVAGTLVQFALLAGSSVFYRFHLPLAETKRRARQLDRLVRAPHFTVEGSTLLVRYKDLCGDLKEDARRSRLFAAPVPIGRTLETITRLLGLAPYLSFPASCDAAARPVPVLSITALMVELETLYTVAKIYRAHRDRLVFPTIVEDVPTIQVARGAHPVLFFEDQPSVANALDSEQGRVKTHVFTGPNTGGKTTFQQGNMLNAILAMAGLPVPAEAMRLSPAYILTSSSQALGSVAGGRSTFRGQAERIVDLLHFVRDPQRRHPVLLILDEILTGTTAEERRALERATVRLMHQTPGVLTIIATHDRSLTRLGEDIGPDAGAGMDNIRVSLHGHEVLPGASEDYNAIEVLRESGASETLLNNTLHYLNRSLARDACDASLKDPS